MIYKGIIQNEDHDENYDISQNLDIVECLGLCHSVILINGELNSPSQEELAFFEYLQTLKIEFLGD